MPLTREPFHSCIGRMIRANRANKVDSSGLFLTIAIVCGLIPACLTQTDNATISGRVTDSSRSGIPAAEVVLKSTEQGAVVKVTTNEAGIYVFAGVHPGPYRLTVSKEGFKTEDYIGLVVNV